MPGARVVRSLDMGPPSRLPCRRYEMSEPTGDEVRVIQWGWAPGPTFATGPQGWAASFSGSFVERAVITPGATTLGHYTERGFMDEGTPGAARTVTHLPACKRSPSHRGWALAFFGSQTDVRCPDDGRHGRSSPLLGQIF